MNVNEHRWISDAQRDGELSEERRSAGKPCWQCGQPSKHGLCDACFRADEQYLDDQYEKSEIDRMNGSQPEEY